MRKIKLNAEKLQVESFKANDEPAEQGTVVAHASAVRDGCVYPTAVYHSCAPGETYGEHSCYCQYPDTDIQMCCTEQGCTGNSMC